uniref:Myelin oligodendrocyte glycoprotein n=1 Tax=Pipistrellus kuhlii TaxID=59472 RepID=A0A7J7R5A2_PIPKU|nr:myelin oligodendrocyte glycoprotein [Pipistrellus kuhlii]
MASSWCSPLPGRLPLLLLLLQSPSSHAGQFRVLGPERPVRALAGRPAELPCRLAPARNASGMEVGWARPPDRMVHLFRGGRDRPEEQAPEFRGRTELLPGGLAEGRAALRIRRVRPSDAGGYTCFFRDHAQHEEAALELQVEGKLRAEIESLHRTFDPHFLRVPCWKVTLFVAVPVLGPLAALVVCYNWLHRRLAGQFLEELRNPF